MSNVLGTFALNLIILVVRFVPFFCCNWLCANVDFIVKKWSFLANFTFASTYKWWHTIVSMDFHFLQSMINKNYNNSSNYVVLASLQSGHFQESIMVFDMFGVKFQSSLTSSVKDLTL